LQKPKVYMWQKSAQSTFSSWRGGSNIQNEHVIRAITWITIHVPTQVELAGLVKMV